MLLRMLPSRLCLAALVAAACLPAQQNPDLWTEERFQGLEFRSIGPALMSGRIADIVINPEDPNTWYVGVGSGGIWKTENGGTTWTTVFDDEDAYSIGAITLDPNDPDTVWVGTGENVSGRHVAYGLTDGAGRTFELRADQLRQAANHAATGFAEAEGDARLFSGQFVPVVRGDTVFFTQGTGHGHGVGMSQYGAQSMAHDGHRAATILATYYPGATPVRAY